MTSENQEKADETPKDRTSLTQRYAGVSRVEKRDVQLVGDLGRPPVRFCGTVNAPLQLREAFGVLHAIVQSDLSYKPKDRSAYLAYQRLKRQSAGMSALQSQQAYFDWLARNDPLAWFVLDPVITVHPDALLFEVFSKDEGIYAQLSLSLDAFTQDGDTTFGTTNIDFSDALAEAIQRMRSYRETRLVVGADTVTLQTEEHEAIEKRVQVPDSWLRGFLQVQSSATLARTSVSLAPMDLYNLLRHLRLNADRKREGRAIRVELIPGEYPRLVLEPWEEVLQTTQGVYQGDKPRTVRIWGRRRWMLLKELLPFVRQVDLHLLGNGLPSFLVLRADPITLTVGLSGFSSSQWSQKLHFDVLLPRPGERSDALDSALTALRERHVSTAADLAEALQCSEAEVLSLLQAGCQNGEVMYDLARDCYRYRPLTTEPLDAARLRYRSDRERIAHDLVTGNSVTIIEESAAAGGQEITAKVREGSRRFHTTLAVGDNGNIRGAQCTCAFFREHRLKEGPCEHLMAVRLTMSQRAVERAKDPSGGRDQVTVQTRAYSRRDDEAEHLVQLSLNRKKLRVRWGQRSDTALRVQNLVFSSVEEARADYFRRVDDLEGQGYLNSGAGES